MIDEDRWQFRVDLVMLVANGGFLCVVLLEVGLFRPTGLAAGLYGTATVMSAVATVASLLVVRQQMTNWKTTAESLELMRIFVIPCPVVAAGIGSTASISEQPWQLLIGLPTAVGSLILTIGLCVGIYTSHRASVGDQSVDAA